MNGAAHRSTTARFAAVRGVLIDLDGTLLDTAPDLAAATNAMLDELGRPPLPLARVAAFVGKGADVLVHRALTDAADGRADTALHARGKDAFFRHYRRTNGLQARVFDGVPAALARLRAAGLPLAVVTNKPREFTVELLARVHLAPLFDAVVAGGDTARVKPDPAPMLLACTLLARAATDCVAIGDSGNDVAAAHAAGCRTIVVTTGYNEGQPVETLPADAIVAGLPEAAALLLGAAAPAAARA